MSKRTKKAPTSDERVAALEAKVAALEAVIASHKSALDVYPALADWCDKVQRDLGSLFENDKRIAYAVESHRHHPVLVVL